MFEIITGGNPDVPLFVIPTGLHGLLLSIAEFTAVVLVIYLFERLRFRRASRDLVLDPIVHRILLWEMGTVVALIASHVLGRYYVVLPLLFLLTFLSMWYLVRIIGHE